MYRSDDRTFPYTARPALELDGEFWVVGRVEAEVSLLHIFDEGGRYRQRRPGRAVHGDYDYPARTTKGQLREWWERDFDDGRYELVFEAEELADTLTRWDFRRTSAV